MRKFHLLKERITEWNKEVFWGLGNRKGSGGENQGAEWPEERACINSVRGERLGLRIGFDELV
jgi:hypothetical protein